MRLYRWDQEFSTDETTRILTELALYHASLLTDREQREYVTTCLSSGRILDLCGIEPDYTALSVHDAIHLRQISAFFQKRSDLELGIDRKRVAVIRFIEAEKLCFETNVILEKRARGEFVFSPRVERVLFHARRKVSQILGDVPALEDLKLRFGPGATTQVPKRSASARRKLSQVHACSEELLPVVKDVLEEMPSLIPWGEGDTAVVPVEIHAGNLVFVPKSFKTDRSVVVEPSLNTMVQAGIGDYMSGRLRHSGIDLRDQSRNKALAREGSITGALATLDLSSASDTIAIELVHELLPVDWFLFLSQFRTGTCECDGVSIKLQKFSSMGNGFTFPLESLIFYALASSCVNYEEQSKVSVYGDDIIVPTPAYELLCEVLNAVGFIPNREKSFSSGPFRESCGGDYLSGIDIRPVYQKQTLTGQDLFRIHNFYVRKLDPCAASLVLKFIDPSLHRWGPDGYGDGHLIGDQPLTSHKRDKGWSGYVFETYVWKPRKDFKILPGDRVYPSYCIYADSPLEVVAQKAVPRMDEVLHWAKNLVEKPPHEYDKRGRFGVSIPGVRGVKLVKIYVLAA